MLASAVAFSLTGTLTKLIESDTITVVCWRGAVGGLAITLYVLWRDRRRLREGLRLGWRGWLLATVGALATLAFIGAFKLTYVANVAIIYAIAPFVTALLGWLMLSEPPRRATLLAALASFVGVAAMVVGGLGAGTLLGNLMALAMTLGCALYMVLIRMFRDQPVVLAAAASCLQLFAVSWLLADPLAVSARDAALLLAFGLSFALAVVLWTEGTRLIPAAESSLFGTAEVPFAILFAWLILAELPPVATALGGAIVLAAVFVHAAHDAFGAGGQ